MKHCLKPLLILSCLLALSCTKRESFLIESDGQNLIVEKITDSISVPFGMAFLPSGKLLVTDRLKGKIWMVDVRSGEKDLVEDIPTALTGGDGGMLDIVVHREFDNNHWIYFSYSISQDSLSTMVVERARLDGKRMRDRKRIFTASPHYKEPNHFGSRLVLHNGYLYITMGERYFLRDSAQTLSNHLGKVMRLNEDGSIPADNPFIKTLGARQEIWSYGHRNPQGLTVHPATGDLWEHEHGPKGGDEINIIRPALNYGWPVICYGIDYDGKPISAGITEKEGMEQPFYYYTPSIAPSGMEFYTSDVIPHWKGNLFIGAMALKHLNRLVIGNEKVLKEERLLADRNWRVRCVRQGGDGFLYIGVDGAGVYRIRPQ